MANTFTNFVKDLGDGELPSYLQSKYNLVLTPGLDPLDDPFSSYVVFFSKFDSTPIVDTQGHTVTLTAPASLDTSNKYDGASSLFSGSGGSCIITAKDTNLVLDGDFTIECMIRYTAIEGMELVCRTTGTNANQQFRMNYPSAGFFYIYSTPNIPEVVSSVAASFVPNVWHHIAITREGSTVRFYCDGYKVGTDKTGSGTIYLANNVGDSIYINGGYASTPCNIDLLRITRAARYTTSTYTPPWELPINDTLSSYVTALMRMDTDSFVDEKGNTVTKHGSPSANTTYKFSGAASADVNGVDYLHLPASVTEFGSSDFCIEAYVRPIGEAFGVVARRNAAIYCPFEIFITPDRRVYVRVSANNSTWASSAQTNTAMNLNSWNHIAVVRQSGTIKVYINGVVDAGVSLSLSSFTASSEYTYVGRCGDYSSSANRGFIDLLRITNGHCRYTGTFTPDTKY